MTPQLEIIGLDELRPLLDPSRVIACVRQALIKQARGEVQSPLPGQLLFAQPRGDCHIKFGHVAGGAHFAVKVATGFYDNPARGLPVNHGLVLVLDAHTGAPRVLLNDEGWLTAWRTAAATAIAAEVLAPSGISAVGIIGAGLQARLAIEWLPHTLGSRPFLLWSRSTEKATALSKELASAGHKVRSVASIDEVLQNCEIVVTATPSTQPLFHASQVCPGTHLVGVGADSPGKQEISYDLFARAAHVLTDDHAQCLDHGDFGTAVRAGMVGENADVVLGHVLSGDVSLGSRAAGNITIVDLTGIAAEDIAIAELFCELHAARVRHRA
jgi:ornithine cyclodeaminase